MTHFLALKLLGGFELQQNQESVITIKASKTFALLSYLAVNPRLHTRTSLAGLLWGGMPEAKARGNLSKALSTLRPILNDYLTLTRQSVTFEPDTTFWLDVAAFEARVSDGAIEALEAAVALYTGDFLAGLTVRNAPEFENWVLAQQTHLKALNLQALHTLATYFGGQHDEGRTRAIGYVQDLLQLEPWREEAHRQLMRLLAETGQRTAALAQYEICQQVLAEEFSVGPASETTGLYEWIREGTFPHAATKQDSSGSDWLTAKRDMLENLHPALIQQGHKWQTYQGHNTQVNQSIEPDPQVEKIEVAHNLPPQVTPLIGRENELNMLAALITDVETQLITIVGHGGMGKTRLAIAIAEAQVQQSQFANGVYFVSLAALSKADTIISAIGQALAFPFQNDGRTPQQQLFDFLAQKQTLLILDNIEHLLIEAESFDIVAFVADLLQAAKQSKVLVTSRMRLQLHQEQLYPLHGLAFQTDETHEATFETAAAKLFLRSARRSQPDFVIGPADVPYLTRICTLVEGMPLGLELAASWVDTLSLADIAAEIQQSLDILETNVRNIPKRHRSMRAVFDTSWQHLSETEQQTFAQLSVFRGGFTREAAKIVAGASLRTLASLVSKSLLWFNPQKARYEIHELSRQYAGDQLSQLDSPEASTLQNRHAAYYCAFLHQNEDGLKGPQQQETLAALEVENGNIRSAWQWAVKQNQVKQVGEAIESLGLFYLWRGLLQEGLTLCQLASNRLAETASDKMSPRRMVSQPLNLARTRIKIFIWSSRFRHDLMQLKAAQQALAQVDRILHSSYLVDQDTRFEQACLLLEKGKLAIFNSYEEARSLLEQCLAVHQTIDDPWHKAQAHEILSDIIMNGSGQTEEAVRLAKESLALRKKLGGVRGVLQSLIRLSDKLGHHLQFEAADQYLQQSIAIIEEINDQPLLGHALNRLGGHLMLQGEFTESLRLREEHMKIRAHLGMPTTPLYVNGFMLMHLGQYEAAKDFLNTVMPHFQDADNKEYIGYSLHILGRIALVEGRYKAAEGLQQQSIAIFQQIKSTHGEAEPLGVSAYIAAKLAKPQVARQYLIEALQIVTKNRRFLPTLTALTGVALFLAHQGQKQRAIELYEFVLQHNHVARSRWYADVVGQEIRQLERSLSADEVIRAKSQGRNRDLWQTAEVLLTELQTNADKAAKPTSPTNAHFVIAVDDQQ